jgi:hypothetical protein
LSEKSGFRIFACNPSADAESPNKETGKKIERAVTKLFQEHLIIYYDESKCSQIWQLAVRKAGFPTKISEAKYFLSQDPELLYQRTSGLFFTIDEEEKITIVDVTRRVSENFQKNNETVTKKFYEKFKKEHTAFLKFIEGIGDKVNQDWYASLMLNRLMFCYFIQKQRFLDNNTDYLQQKLKECEEKKGKNKFYSFYRDFLLALFHKGLGAPNHGKEVEIELGKIPYLNGGLFDIHELEKTYTDIKIDDKAFQRLFAFFDQWNWHLDTREEATGKDINPDVIGYIFEKYINDRAQMGAYYTKEDITDYIGKNCIIPWLFDEVKRNYPAAFKDDGWLWNMVKESNTEYIYNAVKHGVPEKGDLFADLPAEIQKGFVPELEDKIVDGKGPYLWELRNSWNKSAPADIALPTEIYREVIERRKRYADLKEKIESGTVREINDFITYNLNIRQFAQDVIENTEDSDFLRHFYRALTRVTILDPTCGSGAFLFAAMNILEPLYETCIERMQEFVAESGKGKYKFFKDILKQVNAPEHSNLQYFIYKSIILNNLYGVDIMNEAVEIAKLRLFLNLMATVEADYRKPNIGLEPLPDVDFNIRAGNTLVGYATKSQIDNIAGMFVTNTHKKKILEQCDIVARAFERYKEIQLCGGEDYIGFKKAKDELNGRLKKLTDDLDKVCFIDQYKGDERDENEFLKWLGTHKPFHWFAEFYEIVEGGKGFDVVIGNPPYVEIKDVTDYALVDYPTSSKLFVTHWSGDAHPSKLFEGVDKRLQIVLSVRTTGRSECELYTSHYLKWYAEERPFLFDKYVYYTRFPNSAEYWFDSSLPKITNTIEMSVFRKLAAKKNQPVALFERKCARNSLYYTRKVSFFLQFLDFIPMVQDAEGRQRDPSELKILTFQEREERNLALAALSFSLFYWFNIVNSDCRNLNKREIAAFPLGTVRKTSHVGLPDLISKLMASYQEHSSLRSVVYKKKGEITVQYFNFRPAKPIMDRIDAMIAEDYNLTHHELDSVVNYDIKYRMGKELEGSIDT